MTDAGAAPVDGERYPRLLPGDLDAAAAELREAIVGGARVAIPGQPGIAAEDGSLNGPFGILLAAPSVGGPLQQLGAALRTAASLSPREREIGILALAAELGAEYELSVHVPTARAAGVSEDEVRAVLAGDPLEDRREHVLARFVRANARVAEPHAEFEELTRVFDRQAVVEVLALVAYYRGLASMLGLMRIRVDAPLAPGYAPAPTGREDRERLLDIMIEEREITELLKNLARCVDSFDFEGLARLYAEDGELVTPWGGHRGRAGLAEHVRKDLGHYAALHHVSAGHQIDVLPGATKAKARMTLLATHADDATGKSFSTAGGHYEIDLVREHGLWRLGRVRIVPAWNFTTEGGTEVGTH